MKSTPCPAPGDCSEGQTFQRAALRIRTARRFICRRSCRAGCCAYPRLRRYRIETSFRPALREDTGLALAVWSPDKLQASALFFRARLCVDRAEASRAVKPGLLLLLVGWAWVLSARQHASLRKCAEEAPYYGV